jgi:nicotinate-nucleotide--dimethylbenzimidazole phosphoribosyltransferase
MNTSPYPVWLGDPLPAPDARFAEIARARQSQLTKPAGSLGELEHLAVRLAALQSRERPSAQRVHITVFAADHGVAAEGVSAYPQSVTAQMIDNFAAGGAAIAVMAHALGARFEVVDLGTASPRVRREPRVVVRHIGPGTANLAREAAMSAPQLAQALWAGAEAAHRAAEHRCDLFVGGEMGIANTTSASALAGALLGLPAAHLAGPGTGLDTAGVAHKAVVIDRALALHGADLADPIETLRRLGGFEIAALAGAYIACAQLRIASVVDGFIASVAALCAVRIVPALSPWLICAHRSAEPGHAAVLQALEARPLLDLGLRLGEGSGAALAIPLLRAACALHAEMATFGEAGVAARSTGNASSS